MARKRQAKPCKAHKTNGADCPNYAMEGQEVCHAHGGRTRASRQAAARRQAEAKVAEVVSRWRVGDPNVDPLETLLGLLTQSRWRADLYADLLEQAYVASERLASATRATERLIVPEGETDGAAENGQEHADVARAREDLARIFTTGGVAALIGNTYAATKDGDVFATGEAIRGLAKLEADERDRCARFAKLALDAGVAEKQVRIAEKQAEMLGSLMRAALTDAGLGDRVQEVLGNVGRRLRALPGGSARPA